MSALIKIYEAENICLEIREMINQIIQHEVVLPTMTKKE